MKCYTHQLAFAAACAMAIFYTLGALLVLILPSQMLNLWAPLFYLITADPIAPFFGVSVLSMLSGILQSFIYTYIYAWLLGSIYHKLIPCD